MLYHLKLENKNDKMIVDDILMESWRKQKKVFKDEVSSTDDSQVET